MMRTLAVVGLLSSTFLWTSGAKAEGKGSFGQQGQMMLSADRLMPLFSYISVSQVETGVPAPTVSKITDTQVQTSLSFFQGGIPGASAEAAFFSFPRVGFDYVVVPNVTIGGNILFYTTLGGHATRETTLTNGNTVSTTIDAPSVLAFGIAPRGGYILPLSDVFSLWLRGGLSFYASSTKTPTGVGPNSRTDTNNTNQFALDLDPQIVFTPISHIGITAGLTADIPIAGGHSVTTEGPGFSQSASAGSSVFYFGAELGLLGWF